VLLAFPTDIWLERDRGKGRTVKLHMLPLKGSTVGKILSPLLSTYLKRLGSVVVPRCAWPPGEPDHGQRCRLSWAQRRRQPAVRGDLPAWGAVPFVPLLSRRTL